MDDLNRALPGSVPDEEAEAITVVETVDEQRLITDVYSEIRHKLVMQGVPCEEISFIHDCKTAAQRQVLFADVNVGRVRVLIGSTEKMGTGMNAQERLIGLHHLSAPWRSSDIEQREGRILRQGNTYDEVFIFNYVTEGSFDGFLWQILESKATFIAQIMAGEVTARTAEDVGESVLSFAEVKALASGNPKVMQKVALESELVKLSHVYAAWLSGRQSLQGQQRDLPGDIQRHEQHLAQLLAAQQRNEDFFDQPFSMALRQSLNGETTMRFDKREEAGKHLRLLAEMAFQKVWRDVTPGSSHIVVEAGEYRGVGMQIKAFASRDAAPEVWLCISDAVRLGVPMKGESDIGLIQSLDHQVRALAKKVAEAQAEGDRLGQRLVAVEAELAKPWDYAEKFATLKRQLAVLMYELAQAGVEVEGDAALREVEPTNEEAELISSAAVVTEPMWDMAAVLARIREMHEGVFDARDLLSVEMPQSHESVTIAPQPDEAAFAKQLAQIEREIEERVAQAVFGRAVPQAKRGRKASAAPSVAQLDFGL